MQSVLDEFPVRCEAENLSRATILWCRERLTKILSFQPPYASALHSACGGITAW